MQANDGHRAVRLTLDGVRLLELRRLVDARLARSLRSRIDHEAATKAHRMRGTNKDPSRPIGLAGAVDVAELETRWRRR